MPVFDAVRALRPHISQETIAQLCRGQGCPASEIKPTIVALLNRPEDPPIDPGPLSDTLEAWRAKLLEDPSSPSGNQEFLLLTFLLHALYHTHLGGDCTGFDSEFFGAYLINIGKVFQDKPDVICAALALAGALLADRSRLGSTPPLICACIAVMHQLSLNLASTLTTANYASMGEGLTTIEPARMIAAALETSLTESTHMLADLSQRFSEFAGTA